MSAIKSDSNVTTIEMLKQFGCAAYQPSYLKDKLGIKVRRDHGREDDEPGKDGNSSNNFSAQEALEILKKISRLDIEMLGLDPGTSILANWLIGLRYLEAGEPDPDVLASGSASCSALDPHGFGLAERGRPDSPIH